MCPSAHICCMCTGAQRGQKKTSDLLELEFQVVVKCPTTMLGTELSPLEERHPEEGS